MRSVSVIMDRLLLTISFGFLMLHTNAQINSPFTRYGIGEYYASPHVISKSMGGLSAAYADGLNNNVGQSVNFSNPATYGNLYLVTLDLGFTLDSRTLRQENPTGKFVSNTFLPSYLAVGMPLKKSKGIGFAFGLKPVSSINYSIENRERTAGDSLQTIYEGTGGLNQVFVGLSKSWKNLSIGFNTGYNFGRKVINTRKIFINDTVTYKQALYSVNSNFGGAFLTGGLQYEVSLYKGFSKRIKSTENYLLRFGVTGTLKQTLRATQNQLKETYTTGITGDSRVDSVYQVDNITGTVLMPSTYAAGITLHKTITNSRGVFELWSLGMEYTATKWSNYRFFDQKDQVADSWQYKIGMQISPDPSSGQSYWSAANYRAGFYYGNDYIDPDGKGSKIYGVSLGAGLPLRKWRTYDNQFTVINTAFLIGKRGSSVNNVTENYIQFSAGLSLSDLWFQKRKYD